MTSRAKKAASLTARGEATYRAKNRDANPARETTYAHLTFLGRPRRLQPNQRNTAYEPGTEAIINRNHQLPDGITGTTTARPQDTKNSRMRCGANSTPPSMLRRTWPVINNQSIQDSTPQNNAKVKNNPGMSSTLFRRSVTVLCLLVAELGITFRPRNLSRPPTVGRSNPPKCYLR